MTQTVLLGDVGRVVTGKTPPKAHPEYWGDDLDFITPTDFKDSKYISPVRKLSESGGTAMKRIICPAKSVIVTCIGSDMGKVALAQNDFVSNQQINTLIVDPEKASPEFIYYLLKFNRPLLRKYAESGGSTMPIINKSTFERLSFTIPDLETQKKIADILGTIDEKTELNRKMNETLEQMGQALFRHYFIDNPEAEKWEDGTVADLGKVITGKTPSKSKAEYYGGDVMFLKVPDMHGQSIIIKTEDMLSSLGADSQGNKYIPKWSICVSCIATVGVVSLAGRQLQTNQQINSIVPKNRSYALFNYYLLKSKSETLKTMASGGSATPNLNKGHFERIKIKVPPIELLGRFQNESENLLHTVDENTHQIQTLTTLRDTLLPRLLSGKLKV